MKTHVAELYIEHGTKSPEGSVGHALHAQRKAALSADYDAYATLAVEAQNAAVLSGPTFSVIELADKSHKELMARSWLRATQNRTRAGSSSMELGSRPRAASTSRPRRPNMFLPVLWR